MKTHIVDSLGDLEDPEQSQRPQHRKSERAGHLHQVRVQHLKDTGDDDDAVEAVERRLEVDPRPQRVHPDDHLGEKQTEEHELGVICNKRTTLTGGIANTFDVAFLYRRFAVPAKKLIMCTICFVRRQICPAIRRW